MNEVVAVLGATSPIGRALAARFAALGARVVVAGRDAVELERVAKDIALRHATDARAVVFDALDFDAQDALVTALDGAFSGGLDGAVIVYGEQVEQLEAQRDLAQTQRMMEVNYVSPVSLLERLAVGFEARGSGFLCAVSSVAGDRGRPSNYLYGSTKAALSTALAGLRARLAKHGVRVVDVRPGFVDTGLTWGKPGVFGVAQPERVARDIEKAVRRDRAVVYTPGWWRLVMAVIRAIPDFIFKRLAL
jgi:short-subunit dehydrogenase